METVELSRQQSVCMAELPEDYRVVGVERRTPLARKRSVGVARVAVVLDSIVTSGGLVS